MVWPALRFSNAITTILNKRFKEIGAQQVEGRWLVQWNVFPCGMTKASGITPSYYIASSNLVGGKAPSSNAIPDGFMREVYESSGISDYAVFKAVWSALVSAMPRWLIITMQPIDFGYFKVYAFPYRLNWKLNLLAAFPGLRTTIRNVGARKWKYVIPQLKSALFNSKNVELHASESGDKFGWNLEIVPSREFARFTDSVEQKRRAAYPGELYVKQWGAIVAKLQNQIEDVLFYSCKKVGFPAAGIGSGGEQGDRGFRTLTAAGTMRPEVVDRDDLPIVVDPPGDRVTDPSGQEVEVFEAAPMSSVSFVRRRRPLMR